MITIKANSNNYTESELEYIQNSIYKIDNEEATVSDLLEIFIKVMTDLTYSPVSIKRAMRSWVEEHNEIEDIDYSNVDNFPDDYEYYEDLI